MASGLLITDYLSYGSGAPAGAPSLASGSQYALYQDTATGKLYAWDLFTSAWVQVILAPAVTSITGTAHEIIASASTGAITLSTPQGIDTSSTPTFAGLSIGGQTGALVTTGYKGGVSGAHPTSGTFVTGDYVVDTTGAIWVCTSGGTPGTWVAIAGGFVPSTASAQLASPVTMTSANTFYNGPSVSLAAGTWLIIASVQVDLPGAANVTVKLWNGTTVYASGEMQVGGGYNQQIAIGYIVTLGTTTTVKISVASNGTGCSILAAAPDNGAGNNASSIFAVTV